ncbi:MAG: N-acetylmuramoyl-L-alanine amidase [Akkermansiaceae bacterium]|nr:N-acetylmuramoyl-L-alanine amidase [Armatimonadota bacterium]
MRRRTDPGHHTIATLLALAAVSCAAPAFAQNSPSAMPPTASTNPSPTFGPLPQIVIGRSLVTMPDRTRQAFRDAVDGSVCVAPEAISVALGTTFSVDQKMGKVYFINNETGATATATIRVSPTGSDLQGTFVALIPLAEALGGKCHWDAKTNTLYARSVLTSVEMLGSQLRVKGTLPLSPRITKLNGGKTVAFDFPGAEIGTVPRNLTALGPNVVKARTGQFDGNTARIVLELTEAKPFALLPNASSSTVAVMSSAPGVEDLPVGAEQSAGVILPRGSSDSSATTAPPVSVTVGSDGNPLPASTKTQNPKTTAGKPAVPTVLRGVRFVRVSDTQARIIVESPSANAVRTLITKARFTLDVQNAVFGPGTQTTLPEASHPLLKGVQTVNTSATTAQLLIDLSRAVNYTVRLDPKGGFVVDLTLPRGAGGRIAGKLIIVDPGHGGTDGGAKGVNGAREKNVALAISRRLAEELREKGANVIMTRDSDSFVPLGERSDISNRAGADMFIAVHADAAGSRANGSTVYYHLNDASERILANCIADRLREMGGIRTQGSRSDGKMYTNGFSVLRRTNTLAILCETGYMTNSRDVALLVKPEMQAKIARSIANGIQDYVEGNSDMTSLPTPAPSSVAIAPSTDDDSSPGVTGIEQPKK